MRHLSRAAAALALAATLTVSACSGTTPAVPSGPPAGATSASGASAAETVLDDRGEDFPTDDVSDDVSDGTSDEAGGGLTSAAAAPVPDPCTTISPQQVAAWAGGRADESATLVPEEASSDKDSAKCGWHLPDRVRSELRMDDLGPDSTDVTVELARYNPDQYGGPDRFWYPADPDTLLQSYYDAHQEHIGSNAIAQKIGGSPPAVQDGSTVVVAHSSERWFTVDLYLCHYNDCGDQAVTFARKLSAAITAGTAGG